MKFNAKEEINRIVDFIKNQIGDTAIAVIGISGGKDSTIAAALCVQALGKDRVRGVLMPNGHQADIKDSYQVVETLGIKYNLVDISQPFQAMKTALNHPNIKTFDRKSQVITFNDAVEQNLAPRLRMATLYAVAQSFPEGGRVICTCNASEDYIGYSTKWGDNAGDLAPLAAYTVNEILQIGDALGLPTNLVHKAPSDGLCGKTDEDNFGFTYAMLDKYIMTGECDDANIKHKIDRMHKANLHKLNPIPVVER